MTAYRRDVIRISRYEWNISELPEATAIFEVQKHGRASANTLLRQVSYISKMAVCNRKLIWTYISACVRYSNKIPTVPTNVFDVKQRLDWSKYCRYLRNQATKNVLNKAFWITHNSVALDLCSLFDLANYTSTGGHNYKLVKPTCNNARWFTFACRQIDVWNNLPVNVVIALSFSSLA